MKQRQAFTIVRRERDGTIVVRHNLTEVEYPVDKSEFLCEDHEGNIRYIKR